jgi:signal transduction histidine kinase
VALGAAFAVNITLQLVHVLGSLSVPLPGLVASHVVTLVLIISMALWAPRRAAGRLARLPGERQVRRSNPMPYISAALLPVLTVYVYAVRDERPWGVPFLSVVVLAVVALNAVRYTAMSNETRRLYGDLARMSEERKRLLADMLRALEDDRHRTATELHTQAVTSLTALATTVQTAYVALPPDTALAIKEALSQAHDDLADRAEEIHRLMVAMRPPALDTPAIGKRGDALAAALRAYASETYGEPTSAAVRVHVDPRLDLDWATGTIAYRIAQEALLNAAHHALASTVDVRVVPRHTGILVEVQDDGAAHPTQAEAGGAHLATMELFAQFGRGELTVDRSPDGGTVVRAVLGARSDEPPAVEPRRRLRVVSPPDAADDDAPAPAPEPAPSDGE